MGGAVEGGIWRSGRSFLGRGMVGAEWEVVDKGFRVEGEVR